MRLEAISRFAGRMQMKAEAASEETKARVKAARKGTVLGTGVVAKTELSPGLAEEAPLREGRPAIVRKQLSGRRDSFLGVAEDKHLRAIESRGAHTSVREVRVSPMQVKQADLKFRSRPEAGWGLGGKSTSEGAA